MSQAAPLEETEKPRPPTHKLDYMGPRKPGRRALVVLSGGQDSFVTALLAQEWCEEVHAVHYSYGQRHAVETAHAVRLATELRLPLDVQDLGVVWQVGNSELVRSVGCGPAGLMTPHPKAPQFMASFVPGRNALFLTAAAMMAFRLDVTEIWIGVGQADFLGYPDCRENFLEQMQRALRLAFDQPGAIETERSLRIVAPLLNCDKAEIFMLAAERGRLDLLIEQTHTCYAGERNPHTWGHGCGGCAACLLRAKGYEKFLMSAPPILPTLDGVGRVIIDEKPGQTLPLYERLTQAGHTMDEAAQAFVLRERYFRASFAAKQKAADAAA